MLNLLRRRIKVLRFLRPMRLTWRLHLLLWLLSDIWVAIGSCLLRSCLLLRSIRLMLIQMLIISCSVLISTLSLRLLRNKAPIWSLRVCLWGTTLWTRRTSWWSIYWVTWRLSDRLVTRKFKLRLSRTTKGLVYFSPVMNGCIRACCGVHRWSGSRFNKPWQKSMNAARFMSSVR